MAPMAGPETQTRTPTREQEEQKKHILPPYQVVLHNDPINEMAHVVRSLLRSVPSLNLAKATEIMFEAHNNGRARVVVCPLELAELYRDRLQGFKLTATIERA